MKKKLFIAILIAGSYFTATAQTPSVVLSDKPGWHKIAERKANFKVDHDEIIVLGNDHFRQLKLKVKDGDINLLSFTVYFDDDQMQVIQVNSLIKAGTETAATDINPEKAVKRIILYHKTISTSGKHTVMDEKMITPNEKERERESEKENEKERAEVEVWGLK